MKPKKQKITPTVEHMNSIAEFHRVVKNYIKMVKIEKQKTNESNQINYKPFFICDSICYTFIKSFKITCEFIRYVGELRIATEDTIKEVTDEYLVNEKKYKNF